MPMASIGEINARAPRYQDALETEDRPVAVYFGIFFDGTGNNMIQAAAARKVHKKLKRTKGRPSKDQLIEAHKNNGLNENGGNRIDEELRENDSDDFSNIAALHNTYTGLSENERSRLSENYNVHVFNLYIEGPGTEEVDTQDTDWAGLGLGQGSSGVVALVAKTMRLVNIVLKGLNINPELENKLNFDLFGFSRGATCARMFAHYVNGDLAITRRRKVLSRAKAQFLCMFKPYRRKVSFLGIFDTVSSIGFTYDNNNIDYGLYSPNEWWVEHTFHICALDEFRDRFRLTDVGASSSNNALEIFIPGCHSDIGGGYKTGTNDMVIRYASTEEISPRERRSAIRDGEDLPKQRWQPLSLYNSIELMRSEPVSASWLDQTGWHDGSNPQYNISNNWWTRKLTVRRFIKRGFSNLPLALMREKGCTLSNRSMFNRDTQSRFSIIPADLKALESKIKRCAGGATASGRYAITPGTFEDYRKLRSNYLHYSANDTVGYNVAFAPTTDEGRTLNRIVYRGDIGSRLQYYLYSR